MFYQLCVNELAKVLRRRGTYLFLAAVVGLYGLVGIGIKMAIASGKPDMYVKYGVETMTGNVFPLNIITEFAGTIAPLFALFLSGLLVTGELADGTVKLSLLRPVRRVSFVAAKFMAIATYALATLPAVGFAAIALLVAFNARTVGGQLGIGLGVFVALSLGGSLLEAIRPILVTSYGSLALGIYPDVELSVLLTGGGVSLSYAAVFTVVAALQFIRRDVLA